MYPSLQLLCFAHAGASSVSYLRWRRGLPASIEVVPVELPGRGRRRAEPFVGTLEQALCAIESALGGEPTRPFALFGHSLGACLAFAYAQRLRSRGARSPLMLFASASHAPGTRRREPRSWSDSDLRDELLRLDGTPAAVLSSPELLELALPVLRADYQLAADLERQLTRAPIDAPIHVLAGTRDDVAPSALAQWAPLTERGFQQSHFAGGHFYLQDHEPALLALIAHDLMRVARGPAHATASAQGGRHGQIAG